MIGVSDRLKRWIVEAPPDEAWIDVLEFTHPAWPQGFIVCAWPLPLAFTAEDGRTLNAQSLSFTVDPPDAGTDARQDMAITLDNVGAEMWLALEQAQLQPQFPIKVVWRVYTNKVLTYPQAVPVALTLTNITATEQVVQVVASRSDLINARWPRVVYRSERWPGLVR